MTPFSSQCFSAQLILSRNNRGQNWHDLRRRCRRADLVSKKRRNRAVFKRAALRQITRTKFLFSVLICKDVVHHFIEFFDDPTENKWLCSFWFFIPKTPTAPAVTFLIRFLIFRHLNVLKFKKISKRGKKCPQTWKFTNVLNVDKCP